VDCMHQILQSGELHESLKVICPLRDQQTTTSYLISDDNTAYMEVANSSGLQMVPKERRSPWEATSVVSNPFEMINVIYRGVARSCENVLKGQAG